MVDVGAKANSDREARAAGMVLLSNEAYDLARSGSIAKGDVVGVARIAGIMAAKRTPELIPLAHPLSISKVEIEFFWYDDKTSIEIIATVGTVAKTGVEMEALTAVSVAALTIYDMCKAVDKAIEISDIRLLRKSGGKSGIYERGATP
jgi:cyclic pyranopterin phosphate synthase